MDLQSANDLAIDLMRVHGLLMQGWKFHFDYGKRRFGRCSDTQKRISVSAYLTLLNDEKYVRETILHEIAHALVGCKNHHNSIWKAKCIELGISFSRCYSKEVKVLDCERYVYKCNNCGREARKIRKYRKRRACRKCCDKYNNGRFTDRFLLVLKERIR